MGGTDWGSIFSDPDTWSFLYGLINDSKNPDGVKVITTPNDDELHKRKMALLDYSPARDYISSVAHQGISQIGSSKPEGSFKSEYLSGEKFMGGYQPVQFDLSKVPKYWEKPQGPATTQPPVTGGGGRPGGGGKQLPIPTLAPPPDGGNSQLDALMDYVTWWRRHGSDPVPGSPINDPTQPSELRPGGNPGNGSNPGNGGGSGTPLPGGDPVGAAIKAAGPPSREETIEQYIARVVGAGTGIPPALIDGAIDLIQGIYRKFRYGNWNGQQTPPPSQPPVDDPRS